MDKHLNILKQLVKNNSNNYYLPYFSIDDYIKAVIYYHLKDE